MSTHGGRMVRLHNVDTWWPIYSVNLGDGGQLLHIFFNSTQYEMGPIKAWLAGKHVSH